jgi:GT2 family glycosyltransferase
MTTEATMKPVQLWNHLEFKSLTQRGWRLHQMWNDALSRNSGSPVAILNNDIEIGSNFISAMIAALESDKSLAVVCPNYDGRDGEISYVADIQAGRMDGTGGIAGWAYMIPADWADSFRFPEELTWWYGDNVLVDSIVMAGRRCGITGSTTVIHLDGGSKTGNWTAEMVEPDRVWYEQWRSGFSA